MWKREREINGLKGYGNMYVYIYRYRQAILFQKLRKKLRGYKGGRNGG